MSYYQDHMRASEDSKNSKTVMFIHVPKHFLVGLKSLFTVSVYSRNKLFVMTRKKNQSKGQCAKFL